MATCKFNQKRQRWVIRYYDHNNKRGWETMPKGTIAKEARRRTREIEDAVETKTFKRPTQIPTFSEVAQQWLQARSAQVRHTTLAQYQGHVNKHLDPYFGSMKTNEITLQMVERFISECAEREMHPNTTKKILTTLD